MMMTPKSAMPFGMHKGKLIEKIFEKRPDYLYWLLETGFSDFGKEVTEALLAWEEKFPDEAARVKASALKKKKEMRAEGAADSMPQAKPSAPPPMSAPPPPVINYASRPEWGSW